MAKSKWLTHVKPRLVEIACWARRGVIDKDIAAKLGIAYSTFRAYRDEHVELAEVLQVTKGYADAVVESALFEKATGITRTIQKPIKLKRSYYDAHGKKVEEEYVQMVEEELYYPPETSAIIYWTKNRDPENWKDKVDASFSGALSMSVGEEVLDTMLEAIGYERKA